MIRPTRLKIGINSVILWHSERRCRSAFTLIELLVTISIISTLIATLLPSLKQAREQSKTVVCTASTAAIFRASAAYSADQGGWIAGSPGTSGSVMYRFDPKPMPAAEDIPTNPVQIWDYAGPLAGKYMKMSLPHNRAERFKVLLDGVFRCPANQFEADPYPSPTGSFERQTMVSYNTCRNFMMWSRTSVDRDASKPWGARAPFPEASFDRIGGNALHPRPYMPHQARVANPAGKVFLADGNRYTDQNGRLTYDLDWDALDGGAFSNGGPTLLEYNGYAFVLSAYHFDRVLGQYAYRHHAKGQRGIAVTYFDGHAEFITESQSRHPDRWWPKGTVIHAEEFNQPTLDHIENRLNNQGAYRVGR